MFTNNYKNVMTSLYVYAPSRSYVKQNVLTVKSEDGGIINIYRYDSNNSLNYTTMPFTVLSSTSNDIGSWSGGLIIGSGNTLPTINDYCLVSKFTSSQVQFIRQSTTEVIYNQNTDTYSWTYSKTYMALENIVVNEIGVWSSYSGSTGGNSFGYLAWRDVITPVSVSADSTFTITMNISAKGYQLPSVESVSVS